MYPRILLKYTSKYDILKAYLKEQDILTMGYYPTSMHEQTLNYPLISLSGNGRIVWKSIIFAHSSVYYGRRCGEGLWGGKRVFILISI